MFQNCNGLLDVLKVLRDADQLKTLGMVTATAIVSSALVGMLHVLAQALGLGTLPAIKLRDLVQWLRRLLGLKP